MALFFSRLNHIPFYAYMTFLFIHLSMYILVTFMSAVVNAAAMHSCCCSVITSILKNRDSPHETVPIPLPQPLAPTILFSVSREPTALGTFYEWTQTSFVLLYLAYVTEYNALRLHPGCSLCWNCLPFMLDNVHGLLVRFSLEETWNIYIHLSCLIMSVDNFRKSHDPKVIHH